MKKIKRGFCAFLIAAMAMVLTACSGGDSKQVSLDLARVSEDLNGTISTDKLTQADSSMLSSIYFFEEDQVKEIVAFLSSGATADEICVCECKDADAAASMKKLFKSRVESQSELYASYKAEEVDKLDNALIETVGNYAVLVVSDDYDTARNILTKHGFKIG